jgi:hypothetical protein
VLREWFFLGDREFYNCEISQDPIFIAGTACLESAAPPPDAIRQIRRELRVDYGKIDYYAIDAEGMPVLFDVNKTIGLMDPTSERARGMARILADGLLLCLQKPCASRWDAAQDRSPCVGTRLNFRTLHQVR